MKRMQREIFLSKTGSIEQRKAEAEASQPFIDAENKWLDAETAYNLARAHADAAELEFEAWRTKESTKRAEMNLR